MCNLKCILNIIACRFFYHTPLIKYLYKKSARMTIKDVPENKIKE